jgi:hypothetical protein
MSPSGSFSVTSFSVSAYVTAINERERL